MPESNETRARVLVVDDEEAFAVNISKLLSRRGYHVMTAYTGESAVKILDEHERDVVVLDLKMPGMGGMDTLKWIKRKKPLVEVIILTGHGSVETGLQGMEIGAFDYAMKPIDIGELQEKIEQARHRKLIREGNGPGE